MSLAFIAARARTAVGRGAEEWRGLRDSGLLGRVAFGLAIGGAGGVVAHWLHVPLAFMLGSLFATMAASIAGLPVASTQRLRMAFMVLIGLFLGQSFESDALSRLSDWPVSVALAMLYVPAASLAGYVFYARAAGLDRRTALLAAIPGGLSGVIMMSEAVGADERQVTLSQSLRIAIVVVSAPALFFGFLGADPSAGAPPEPAQLVSLREVALLSALTIALLWTLARAGVPLPFLIAPLIASAALRLAGLVEGELPTWLVEAALVVVGASLGCRFVGADLRLLARIAVWTVLGTFLMIALGALFALVAAPAASVDYKAALLAFMPGGVAEMCIIALALEYDPSYVATHHLARILFILLVLPAVAAWMASAKTDPPAG